MSQDPPSLPKQRKRPSRWFKVTVITVLVLANLVAAAGLWAVYTGRNLLGSARSDQNVTEVLDHPSGDDLTFVVVGSDSREGLDDLTHFGSFGGARADVVMLVRVDGSSSQISMLSIPRDLWVRIPGHGEQRINAAYAFGGSAKLVETIRENLDVEINHYVEIDFVGFQGLIDELGGIQLTFPNPARDLSSGLDVQGGAQTLDGNMALAYARSRKYEEYRNGRWVSVDANDIGRTQRQQAVMRAMFSKLKSPSSLADAGSITSTLAKYMTIDSRLAGASVASLAWDFRGVLTGSIEGSTVPVTGRKVGNAEVLVLRQPEANEMLADFRAGRASQATDQPLRVQVLNGNGISGSAGLMGSFLEGEGFVVVGVGDAPRKDYQRTTVIVPSGSTNGSQIISALGYGVVQVGAVDNGYDAIVIVGADAR